MKVLKTNLQQKVKNLPSFKSEALLPVFEAVVNSIHAIEEVGVTPNSFINIEIIRSQMEAFDKASEPIQSIHVTDNGIGFNDANYDSFITADSAKKASIGGKGVGRFLWLKAFDRVEIDSCYIANDGHREKK